MIICHIIVGLNIGGAELMLKRLIDSLKMDPRIKRQIVISLTTIGPVGQELQASGVEVYELNIQSFNTSLLGVWTLYKMIRVIRPDIIQTWMYHADLLGGVIGRLAGCKNIVWGIRNTDISIGASPATIKIRWVCAKWSRCIPRMIFCVAEEARRAHVQLGYVSEKMVVIPNGFDFSAFEVSSADIERLKTTYGIQAGDVVIGSIARFNLGKDPYNYVQAAGLIAAKIPNAWFLMVGRNCDYRNHQLTTWIESTGFSERFILLGERKDVPVCLALMDVFCLSSITEGFPNVLGEAMFMQKLCVTTDAGDAAFLLGNCGVVVPKRNSRKLADGVLQLLALSDAEREKIGSCASKRVITEFSIETIKEYFVSFYCQLVA